MKLLKSIAAFFRGWASDFSPLEMAILDEAARQLGDERGARLRSRITRTNRVYRLDGGREVNSYSMKKGKPAFDEAERIVPEDGEKELARFAFNTTDYGKFKGKLWLVNGRFFSIEFNNPTEHILDQQPADLQLILCV